MGNRIAMNRRRGISHIAFRFVSLLLAAVLFAQIGALPMPLGFFFLRGDEKAMTEGCNKKTCCTALCYLDKNGVHHCVHKSGDSCECGISTKDSDPNPILLLTASALPEIEHLFPDFLPEGWMLMTPALCTAYNPSTPSPPPK
jgi:hypothetical protein